MANDVNQQIAKFFEDKHRLSPEVSLPSPEPLPRGWFEEVRAQMFRAGNWGDVSPWTEEIWSELSGKVHMVSNGHLSAIVALYTDGTILWLDDHSKDTDFQNFVHRERLLGWLPYRMDKLVRLLVGTRLNFLGWPLLINSASDVPTPSEKQKALWVGDKEVEEFLLEQAKWLANIHDQIRPPVLVTDPKGGYLVSFSVWTKILGKVINVRCLFGPGQTFRYEGVQLAQLVGAHVVPR